MKQHVILLLIAYFLSSHIVRAQSSQWTKRDSLNLSRLLKNNGEIKLNRGAVNIDFGGGPVTPPLIAKPALKYDETLPSVYPKNEKKNPTLMPYRITESNKAYDSPHPYVTKPNISNLLKPYSNWAQTWRDARPRNSREEIEATGVHYNILGERLNGQLVPAYSLEPTAGGISLGNGITVTTTASGSTISGLDLMAPLTKEFWDIKGRARRARTLEVLKNY
ncbi:hypothetical protein EZS27_025013 [termite gut metagenome]|uniref:DUF4858 domain-containing protein n=1 Tax=termite gut metagenome TaxID=433724 RepID=A0A5J4QWD0_9ZZZZ